MFSDQGTNFVGAERELCSLVKDLVKDDRLKKKLEEGLKSNFNPPASPHMGGAWESMVKPAKRAITATTNGYLLIDEELTTVFAECEAMLNNRPLTYVGCDPEDVDPLTPAHFLNTRHLTPLLPSEIPLENISPKRRWLYLQSIISKVWKRWKNEYLPCIQRRIKWNKPVENLKRMILLSYLTLINREENSSEGESKKRILTNEDTSALPGFTQLKEYSCDL